jgi:hypothetical protein
MLTSAATNEELDLGLVGRCIYCGATEDLQDEHPIPFGLAGRHVLRESSCARCAAMTSRWERLVLRGSLLPFRTILGLPTRRPSDRPTSFPARVKRDGVWADEDLPLARFTAVAPFPKLPPPGAIAGRPLSSTFRVTGWVGITVISNDGAESHPARRAGVEAIETATPTYPAPFMRMLAKIGWCYTVARYGVNAVDAKALGVILGTDDNVAHWVGCPETGWTLFDGPPEADFHVCVAEVQDGWLLSGIRLFGPQGGPEYQVVVGQLRS